MVDKQLESYKKEVLSKILNAGIYDSEFMFDVINYASNIIKNNLHEDEIKKSKNNFNIEL